MQANADAVGERFVLANSSICQYTTEIVPDYWDPLGVPADEPHCGFTGAKCSLATLYIVLGSLLLAFILLILVYYTRKRVQNARLASMIWRLDAEMIRMCAVS